jgi:hypothetical protein
VKTDHGKPATGRRLESSVATAVATFGGTSALKTAWVAVVMAGGPPPSGGLCGKLRLGGSSGAAARVVARF